MSGVVKISDRDRGYKKLLLSARAAAKGAGVSVGIHALEGAQNHEPEVTRDPSGRPRMAGKFISEAKAKEIESRPKTLLPVTVADVAAFNEFGLGVPERSFIRAWFDGATEENRAALQHGMIMALKGEKTIEQVLELIGLRFVGKMQQRISNGISPANAPSTIKQKGSSKPLVDTGQMRQAITYLVRTSSKAPG